MDDTETTPGWYGKLPTLGDFASRRLPPDFIEPWDLWLGEGLAAQRESMGEGWLDAYLQSPVWRFVLMPEALPGLKPQRPLAGVLMPSVDKVGRYFPLTIAATLVRIPQSGAEMELLLAWLHRLEDLAIDALHDDWSVEVLEEELDGLSPVIDESQTWPEHLRAPRAELAEALHSDSGAFVDIAAVRNRGELATLWAASLAAPVAQPWATAAEGRTFWLADNPDAPRLLVARGLPGRGEFAQMLGATGRDALAQTIF